MNIFCWLYLVVIFLIIWFKGILTWYYTTNPFSLDWPIFVLVIEYSNQMDYALK